MAIALVTNIGSSGRQRRYLIGGAALGLALITLVAFWLVGVPRGARLVLLLPLLVGALGFLQAQGGT